MIVNPATVTWLLVGAFLVYMVSQDSNVYDWLVLQSVRLRVLLISTWYRIRYHPNSFWVRYQAKRNAERLTKEILRDINRGKK